MSTASNSSLTRMSTTPFGTWNDIGPTSSGRVDAEAAALDHRRAAHGHGRAFGGDDDVAAGHQRGVAGEAAAVDDRDHRHQAGELRVGGEGVGVDRDARADVVVARPAAAALAEQDHRQPEAMRQLEHAVLLVVVAAALRAGQHRVVVVHQRRARVRLVEQVAVDVAHAGDDAVRRRVPAQLVQRGAGAAARRSAASIR